MSHRIFLAGASGAIGRRLVPLLVEAGHDVVGTTRSPDKADALRALGAEVAVVDVFDAEMLTRAVVAARPEFVMHQLTDLPAGLDPARMASALQGNARIREEGTRNLLQAALAAKARRVVAQSIAWAYTPGPTPHGEGDPLDLAAQGARAVTVRGVVALETAVLGTPSLEGVVLRYGQLYGPGTGFDGPRGTMPLHVDAAAFAAFLALDRGARGVFNVAEPNAEILSHKAESELGWRADFRLPEASGQRAAAAASR